MKQRIKEQIELLKGKKISILVDVGRNKMEEYEGVVTNAYNNIWMLKVGSEEKSFTYTDILIGVVIIKNNWNSCFSLAYIDFLESLLFNYIVYNKMGDMYYDKKY